MRHLAIAALLVACGTESPPATSAPPRTVAASTTVAIAPPPTTVLPEVDPCVIGRARVASIFDGARAALTGHGRQGRDARTAVDALVTAWSVCTQTHGGAWMLLPEEATVEWGDGPGLDLRVRVSFIDLSGTIHPAPAPFGMRYEPTMAGSGEIALTRFFDFDGDGTTEVVATVDTHYDEDSTHLTFLFAYANGAVGPYGPAADIDVSQVVDADEDGRPDIVSIRRYWTGAEQCGEDSPDVGTPAVLFHALPNGAFSPSDDAAATYLRAACPQPPTRLLTGRICSALDTRFAIACARAWGASTDEVLARVATERAQLSDEALEWIGEHDFDAYAAIEPPLVLH